MKNAIALVVLLLTIPVIGNAQTFKFKEEVSEKVEDRYKKIIITKTIPEQQVPEERTIDQLEREIANMEAEEAEHATDLQKKKDVLAAAKTALGIE